MNPEKLIALDTETTGLDLRHGCRPFLVSTCTAKGILKCWEWPVDPITRQPKIPLKDKQEIVDYLNGKIVIFHNAKFDIRALCSIGIGLDFQDNDFVCLPGKDHRGKRFVAFCKTFHETLLASHAFSSSSKHGLKEQGVKHLHYSASDEDKLKKRVEQATRWCKANDVEVSLGHTLTGKRATAADYWLPKFVWPEDRTCLTYAEKDVERTILLWLLYAEVLEDQNLVEGYERERQLLQVVYRMETEGITINLSDIKRKISSLEEVIAEKEAKCQRYLKRRFKRTCNLRSGKELIGLFYGDMRYPVLKKTKKGLPSTDKDTINALMEWEEGHELLGDSIQKFFIPFLTKKSYESAVQQLRNYVAFSRTIPNVLPQRRNKKERRNRTRMEREDWATLYPSLNQSGTGTTRFSCSTPNGQNVSKIVEVDIGKFITIPGARLRDVFGPPPGYVWYAIDYNQLELRVFAAVSDEKSLIEAFDAGYDFHGYVASRIFNKNVDEVTKQERRIAKNVNFALIFGASPKKVNATAGIPNAYEMFSSLFPNVTSYMQKTIREVKQTGYVYTLDGYRLDVSINAPYKAVNYKVQGTAGSIVKQAMIDIDRKGLVDWINAKILLQIHDELIFEVKKGSEFDTPKFAYDVCTAMELSGQRLGISTPVTCDVIESNWGNGVEVNPTTTRLKPVKTNA